MQPASTESSVLFVCMGNICRSPMAEAVFRHQLREAGLTDRVGVDSAATHSYHLGHEPHPQTREELARRGVAVGSQRSRLVTMADLGDFDHIVALDRHNLAELQTLVHEAGGPGAVRAQLSLLLSHAHGLDVDEVPDPYYVGGYDRVYDLVHAGCSGLLELVRTRLEA